MSNDNSQTAQAVEHLCLLLKMGGAVLPLNSGETMCAMPTRHATQMLTVSGKAVPLDQWPDRNTV